MKQVIIKKTRVYPRPARPGPAWYPAYSLEYVGFEGPKLKAGNEYFDKNYSGTPLKAIRRKAKEIATQNGAEVIEFK